MHAMIIFFEAIFHATLFSIDQMKMKNENFDFENKKKIMKTSTKEN
jgi:hypothetical protein